MTDVNFQTNTELDPHCPMGQIVAMMYTEATQTGNAALMRTADVCRKRIHDQDEDLRHLTRAFIFTFAAQRGVDVMRMPWVERPRMN